jgi:hypothetical protein
MAAMDHGGWVRSSKCDSGACLEMAQGVSGVHVRDSKFPQGPGLSVGRNDWRAFLAALPRIGR